LRKQSTSLHLKVAIFQPTTSLFCGNPSTVSSSLLGS
jgi:hypothetical protein